MYDVLLGGSRPTRSRRKSLQTGCTCGFASQCASWLNVLLTNLGWWSEEKDLSCRLAQADRENASSRSIGVRCCERPHNIVFTCLAMFFLFRFLCSCFNLTDSPATPCPHCSSS